MMTQNKKILTIDIGNSRIKCALWQQDVIGELQASDYQNTSLEKSLAQLFLNFQKPEKVFVVSVADPKIAQALNMWTQAHWHLTPDYLTTQKKFKGITHAYVEPQKHGADRWAAMVAGYHYFPDKSLCVISAGTATTIDLLDKSGQHLGGYILPSYPMMRHALNKMAKINTTSSKTSLAITQIKPQQIPNNTDDAINQGLHKMQQASIQNICQLAQQQLSLPLQVIITGGLAATILHYPDMPHMQHEPSLVMQGLYLIKMDKT